MVSDGNGTEASDTIELLVRLARDVSAATPAVAIEVYRRASELLAHDDPARLEIDVACLEPLARAGSIGVARERAEQLLAAHPDQEERRSIHAGLAKVLATAGDLRSSMTHYEASSAVGGASGGDASSRDSAPDTSNERPMVDDLPSVRNDEQVDRCLAAGQRVLLGDDPAVVSAELERLLARSENRHVACAAYQGLSLAAGAEARFEVAARHALESTCRFDPRTMPRAGFLIPDIWVSSFDAFRDRFEEASVLVERIGYDAERRGESATLVHTSTSLGLISFFGGRWDEAVAAIELALSVATETGSHAQLVAGHAVLAGVAFGRGQFDLAGVHLDEGSAALERGMHLFGVDLLIWLRAQQMEVGGDRETALVLLWDLWEHTAHMRGLTHFRSIAPHLVALAVAADQRDMAATVAEETEELALRSAVASVAVSALRCRSLLVQNHDGLAQAVSMLARTPWRIDLARACEDAASAFHFAGRPHDAGRFARQAMEIYGEMRATWWADSVAKRFGVSGMVRNRSESAWDLLTRREREVVSLVRDGCTNGEIAERLFVSPRTVESHVANAIRKMGTGNRTRLAALAASTREP